jgi:hypothetical protein
MNFQTSFLHFHIVSTWTKKYYNLEKLDQARGRSDRSKADSINGKRLAYGTMYHFAFRCARSIVKGVFEARTNMELSRRSFSRPNPSTSKFWR